MKKVLIVNPFGIGDVLFSTPLMAAIKAKYPSSEISFIGNSRTVPFLRNDPRLSRVFSYERDEFVAVYRQSLWAFCLKWKVFVDEIRAQGFDTAFDLSNGSPLSLALLLAGIPKRIGFDYKGRGRWLTHKMPLKGYEGRHVAEYILDLMDVGATRWVAHDRGRPSGSPLHTKMFISPSDETWGLDFLRKNGWQKKAFIVFFPGGGASWGKEASLKLWPADSYRKLAEKIIERSTCPIILMGDKQEMVLCQEIAKSNPSRIFSVAGELNLVQSASLLSLAKCVVASDGGPLHMAVAFDVPTVSIFGPVDPDVYGPYPKALKHRVFVKGLSCQPCYRNFRMSSCRHQKCLKDLTVDEVVGAIKEWIS